MVTCVAIVALLALLVAALWVPVDLHFDAQAGERQRACLRVHWLYDHVAREFSTDVPATPPEDADGDGVDDPLAGLRDARRVWQSKRRDELAALARELIERTSLLSVSIHGRLGLGEPADTGMAMAALLPIADFANSLSRCEVVVQPCYEQAELSGTAHGLVRVVPARLLPPVLRFGLSSDNRRELRKLWRQRGS